MRCKSNGYSGNTNRDYNKWGSYLYSLYNGGNYTYAHGHFSLPSSGKWYFEVNHAVHTGGGNFSLDGIIADSNMRPMAFKTNTRMDAWSQVMNSMELQLIHIQTTICISWVMDKQIQVVYLGLQVTLIYGGVQLT